MKTCQKPYKFDLEVKVQGCTNLVSQCQTKKVMGRTRICKDRWTDVHTDGQTVWFLYTPWTSFTGDIIKGRIVCVLIYIICFFFPLKVSIQKEFEWPASETSIHCSSFHRTNYAGTKGSCCQHLHHWFERQDNYFYGQVSRDFNLKEYYFRNV